ncbi:MAG: GGDEF domain-containing protein, partial [Cellvibrionaceae bacterium]|nr:GGDEF domain-containing protein [Cellvibrionaceae bacterium]
VLGVLCILAALYGQLVSYSNQPSDGAPRLAPPPAIAVQQQYIPYPNQSQAGSHPVKILPQRPDDTHLRQQVSFVMVVFAALVLGLAFIRERHLKQKLQQVVNQDYLTSIYNRRYLFQLGQRYLSRSQTDGGAFSLILLDVDHFKAINDNYGHSAGDRLLQDIAETCSNTSRPADIVGRIGGEEFLMLLPETNLNEARTVAERIRRNIERLPLPGAGLKNPRHAISASFGIASSELPAEQFEDLVNAADQAMYRAKASGRNRVCSQPLKSLKPIA